VLKHRIISGCLIGAALVASVSFMPAIGILALLLGAASLAQSEFYGILRMAGIPAFRVLGTLCGAALIAATFLTTAGEAGDAAAAYKWQNFVLLASLIAVFVRQFPQKHNDKPLATIGCTLLGIWYVPYLFNFFTHLIFAYPEPGPTRLVSETGRMLVLYLVVVVKSGDIGGYFVGTFLGRHKLMPRVSPAKTWEGLFGGIAFSVLASLLFSSLGGRHVGRIGLEYGHAVLLGALLSVVGVVGDMFESLLKRAAGAKDSSSAIPGMGGWLDVLDSLLFGAPVLYVYMKVFLA
jgi:phosphatidate cytidylyltransferase